MLAKADLIHYIFLGDKQYLSLLAYYLQAFPTSAQEEMLMKKSVEATVENVPESAFPGRTGIGEAGTSGSESSVKNLKPKRKKFRGPCAAKFPANVVSSKLAALKETRRKTHLRDLENHRSKLPVAKHRYRFAQVTGCKNYAININYN